MFTGYLFALLSAVSFGISNAWWKKAAIKDDFSRIVFFRGVIAVVIFGLLWLGLHAFSGDSMLIKAETPRFSDYINAIALCFACSLGLVFFLTSLRYAPVSISVPLSSVNIFNILTAVIFLGEVFKPLYAVSFLLAGTGAWLVQSVKPVSGQKWNPGVVYALLAAFFWGVTYALFKYPARRLGAVPLAFLLEACVMISAMVWNWRTADERNKIFRKIAGGAMLHYAFLALLLVGGTLFFNLAIQRIDVLVLNLTGNLTIVTAVVLGWVLLKEEVRTKQVSGILLVLASLLLVQLA